MPPRPRVAGRLELPSALVLERVVGHLGRAKKAPF
jgi:hypothetical protein